MTRFAISMGSNLGDRRGHLRSALSRLSEIARIVSVSSLYESAPVGGPEQGPYLNAVAVVETGAGGHHLLSSLQAIEAEHGRSREVQWGPRTLDLDIAASDGEFIDDEPVLVVPHPRAAGRRFVIEPLAEIWPGVLVAEGVTAQKRLPALADQEVDRLARSWTAEETSQGRLWVGGQLVAFALIGLAIVWQGRLPESIGPWQLVGGLLFACGLALVLWSARSLGPVFTAFPEPVARRGLVTTGPYRWVRHPMYTGVWLVFIGASLAFGSPLAIAFSALLIVFFGLKSGYEESQLRIAFPGYASYRTAVPGRFLPRRS